MSRATVAPAESGTARVRPKAEQRRTQKVREGRPVRGRTAARRQEEARPLRASTFDPAAYINALEYLRSDFDHGDLLRQELEKEDGFDRLVRCKGYDVLAGERVGELVEEGLDPWRIVEALVAVTREFATAHRNEKERTVAQVLLTMWPGLRDEPQLASTDAFGNLLSLAKDEWASSIVGLAHDALCVAITIRDDGSADPGHMNVNIREFVRAAFDHGGVDAMLAVVDQLNQLGKTEGGRS